MVVGPIAFVGVGSAGEVPASGLGGVKGEDRGLKVLAVVDEGVEVTVSVAPRDLGHAALLYDPAAFRQDGLYALSDGDREVTFQSCAKGENPYGRKGPTQFNGGFVVDGPRCVTLEVASSESLKQASISFGAGHCSASS